MIRRQHRHHTSFSFRLLVAYRSSSLYHLLLLPPPPPKEERKKGKKIKRRRSLSPAIFQHRGIGLLTKNTKKKNYITFNVSSSGLASSSANMHANISYLIYTVSRISFEREEESLFFQLPMITKSPNGKKKAMKTKGFFNDRLLFLAFLRQVSPITRQPFGTIILVGDHSRSTTRLWRSEQCSLTKAGCSPRDYGSFSFSSKTRLLY